MVNTYCARAILYLVVSHSITSECLGQNSAASRVLEAIHDAQSSQVGLAVVFQFKAIQLGDKADANLVEQNERIYFQVRTRFSEPGLSDNDILIRLGNSVSEEGVPLKSYRLHAKIRDRIYAATGSDITPFKASDITELSKDKVWSRTVELQRKGLNACPMALPFLGMDAFYFEKYDFQTVRSRFATFRPSYEAEEGKRTVWEVRKTGAVLVLETAEESGYLPTENSFYLRSKGSSALKVGDDLGELVYRTKTSWKKFIIKKSAIGNNKKKEIWVPERIEFEELPNKHNHYASHKAIEIICAWKQVPEDFLNPEILQRPIAIENELLKPNDPVSDLFYEMTSELRRTVSQIERARSSKRAKNR